MKSVLYIHKKYEALSNAFQLPNRSVCAIKSNLLYLMKQKVDEEHVQLPSNLTNGFTCCKWCLNNWVPGKFTTRLLPEKQQKACLRSLLKKDENNLNKFQRKLVRKCKKNSGNKLMFLCHICNKKTIIQLKKPRTEKPKIDDQISIVKKSKKKKKDVYAGLKPSAFHHVDISKKQLNSTSKMSNLNQGKSKTSKRNKPPKSIQKTKEKIHNMVGHQNTGSLLLSLLDPL